MPPTAGPHPPSPFANGSSTVLIGGRPALRIGDIVRLRRADRAGRPDRADRRLRWTWRDRAFLGRGWAFPVQPAPSGEIAEAEYDEDVHQAVRIILGTDLGERVMRPDFGAGLRALVFEPLTTTTRALIQHRVQRGARALGAADRRARREG